MWRTVGSLAAVLPLAACLRTGEAARPRFGLVGVERVPAAQAADGMDRDAAEPGRRGYLFADSLIAFRTRANLSAVRVRLWNRGAGPVRVDWNPSGRGGAPRGRAAGCPESAGGWEMRTSGAPDGSVVLDPGESDEIQASPAVLVRTPRGEAWHDAGLPCMVYEPTEPRAALRVGVEAAGVRYVYTFWYRLVEPPRVDLPGAPVTSGGPPGERGGGGERGTTSNGSRR